MNTQIFMCIYYSCLSALCLWVTEIIPSDYISEDILVVDRYFSRYGDLKFWIYAA